jgi:hypothetical protein
MEKLMSDLRIRATLRVVVLANGQIQSYECLVKGKTVDMVAWSKLERALAGDPVSFSRISLQSLRPMCSAPTFSSLLILSFFLLEQSSGGKH